MSKIHMNYHTITLQGSFVRENPAPQLSGKERTLMNVRCRGKPAQIGLDDDNLGRGVLLVGTSGVGKSNALLNLLKPIRENLSAEDVMVVFDYKGELFTALGKPDDVLIGNGGQGRAPNKRWSIFKELAQNAKTQSDYEENARVAASHIIIDENLQTPIFTAAPRQALEHVLCILARNPELAGGELSNEALIRFIEQSHYDEAVKAEPRYGVPLQAIVGPDNNPNQTALSMRMELTVNVKKALTGFNKGAGCSPLWSVAETVAHRGGRCIYLQYDPSREGVHNQVYSMIVELFLEAALRNHDPRGHIYVVLDEVVQLKEIVPTLQKATEVGLHYGVCMFAAAQSIAQMKDAYGELKTNACLNNFQTKFWFKTSEEESNNYLQGTCGKVLVQRCALTPGVAMRRDATTETSALEQEDINAMGIGDCVYISRKTKPCMLHIEKE